MNASLPKFGAGLLTSLPSRPQVSRSKPRPAADLVAGSGDRCHNIGQETAARTSRPLPQQISIVSINPL